jgi:MFS family permease
MLTLISGVWAVAALLGPLVGGVFAEIGWWRGAFLGPLPVIAGFAAAAWRVLPAAARGGGSPRFPVRRLALLALGVMGVGLAGHLQGLASQLASIAGAAILVGVTLKLDAGAANPLFPSRPLSWRSIVGASNWVFFLQSMTHVSIGIFLPLLVQRVHGLSPLAAGYFNAALAVGWTVGSFATQGWRGRGEDAAIVGGLVLTSLGSIGLAIGAVAAAPAVLAVLSALVGLGIGASNIHLMANAIGLAGPGQESLTASSVPTIRSLGIAFGAAAAGAVANANGLADGIEPWRVAEAVGAVYAAGALAPMLSVLFAARVQVLRRRMGDGGKARGD